ncbi:DddA-like double-stranded DNA deaminase toxin [Amycolatopsis sp. NPDC004079]|uniref:DddA-like double-stranded DNA deaminase toxin n=1 Tax=Amycolatopsis sp. NPDC004079 TaxID=3154549 RepID=UPI0033B602C7
MSVQKIVAAVEVAAEKSEAASARLKEAEQAAEEAGQALAKAVHGSSDEELGHAIGALAQAIQEIPGLGRIVARVTGDLTTYARSLAGDRDGQPDGSRESSIPAPPSGGKDDGPDEDPVEKERRQLPERGIGRGVKTTGRWFAPGRNTSAVTSGVDDFTLQVNAALEEAGCPYVPVTAAADVELKIAAAMRANDIREATVVINNVPCEGPASCDALLGVVLPEGSSMTVHGIGGFSKTYRGGAKPWRR